MREPCKYVVFRDRPMRAVWERRVEGAYTSTYVAHIALDAEASRRAQFASIWRRAESGRFSRVTRPPRELELRWYKSAITGRSTVRKAGRIWPLRMRHLPTMPKKESTRLSASFVWAESLRFGINTAPIPELLQLQRMRTP